MTAREFFESIRAQQARTAAAEQWLREVELQAESLQSPRLGDKIQGNRVSTLDDSVIRLESARLATGNERRRYAELVQRAAGIVRNIRSPVVREILVNYYVYGLSRSKTLDVANRGRGAKDRITRAQLYVYKVQAFKYLDKLAEKRQIDFGA